jgi:hypothetical protein
MGRIAKAFIFSLQRRVESVSRPQTAPLGAATLLTVAFARHLSIHIFLLIRLSAVSIAIVLLLPEILARLIGKPEFAGNVFARRSTVILVLLSSTLASAAILTIVYRPWRHDEFNVESALTIVVQGAFIGAFIRSLFVTYLEKALKGVSTDAVEAMLLLSVAFYLLLFPTSPDRYVLAPAYLAGISAGFLAHFGARGLTHRAARSTRIRRTLFALLNKPGNQFAQSESEAITLYLRESFYQLEKLFARNAKDMTTSMVIIQSSMYRLQGSFDKALTVVEKQLIACMGQGALVLYLHLQKAICLSDLNFSVQLVLAELELVMSVAPGCILAKCTWALRVVEMISYGSDSEADKHLLRRALIQARQALSLAQVEETSLWGGILGLPVPVTWTYLLDVLAYVSLRNGDKTLSKALLEHCITTDPKFSAPYLHLGEWYLIRSFDQATSDNISARDRKLAKLCLNIAKALEGKRESLTKRRAQSLLDDQFGG